jgi:[ribosomal protein S18]-alanine N-acetyltransferase
MSSLSFATASVALMQPEDLAAVIEIERQSNSHPWTERNFRDAIASGYLSLVAREHGQVCAFAIARALVDEAELLLIAVTPSERRQGVAALLWIELAQRLRSAGAATVFLEVRASNAPGRSFYVSRGFSAIGVRKNYYPNGAHDGDREDAVLMQVTL